MKQLKTDWTPYLGVIGMQLILMGSLLLGSQVQSAEIEGYPYDAHAKEKGYHCVEGPQIKVPGEVQNGSSKLLYSLCIDKKFPAASQNILRQAFHLFAARAMQKNIFDCVQKETTLSFNGSQSEDYIQFAKHYITGPLSARSQGEYFMPGLVYISAIQNKAPVADYYAFAYENYYDNPKYATRRESWKRNLSIAVNQTLIANHSTPFGNDINTWAGFLGTAVLRNVGLAKSASNPFEDPQVVFNRCLVWNGTPPTVFQQKEEN